jgi:Arc/MetJ-type ribon-helix-helix transcriptional regulator
MNITLTPDLEKRIEERLHRGDYASPEALVTEAVSRLIDEDEEELRETKAAIEQALEESARGEGRPADEVFAELRAEYGLPR